jgi:hypothetical protein
MPASPDKRAKNELMFREVNERIQDLAREDGSLGMLCECGSALCTATLEIDMAGYEQVRRKAREFIVLPGHEMLDKERVVGQAKGYLVVEKIGHHGAIAKRFDPRSGGAS